MSRKRKRDRPPIHLLNNREEYKLLWQCPSCGKKNDVRGIHPQRGRRARNQIKPTRQYVVAMPRGGRKFGYQNYGVLRWYGIRCDDPWHKNRGKVYVGGPREGINTHGPSCEPNCVHKQRARRHKNRQSKGKR